MNGHKGTPERNRSSSTVIVSFRATAEETAAIDEAAAGDAQQRATWVRQTVLEAIRSGTQRTTTSMNPKPSQTQGSSMNCAFQHAAGH